MDADCTLTVDHAYANFGGLTSIDTSTPSIFLADPTPTASAILMTAGNITSTFAGNIADAPSGSGGIHMIANDNLTLTGHNTYTGPTRIDAGILTQSGGSNNSSVTVSNSGQFVANNTTLSLNGTGGVTVNTGALASYANSTINGGYLAGAGAHFIEGSTLNNTTIQFGATALISNPSVFNNVTLNGTLVTDETLLWSTGTPRLRGAVHHLPSRQRLIPCQQRCHEHRRRRHPRFLFTLRRRIRTCPRRRQPYLRRIFRIPRRLALRRRFFFPTQWRTPRKLRLRFRKSHRQLRQPR